VLEPPLLAPPTWLPPLPATGGAPATGADPPVAAPPEAEPPIAGAAPALALVPPAIAVAPPAPAGGPSPSVDEDEHATAKITAPSAKNPENEQLIKIFSTLSIRTPSSGWSIRYRRNVAKGVFPLRLCKRPQKKGGC
jgi:hypothetical protein